jgi:hypothetical protein
MPFERLSNKWITMVETGEENQAGQTIEEGTLSTFITSVYFGF